MSERIKDVPTDDPQRRKLVATDAMAKYFCLIAGIVPVDSGDGSPNWWIFPVLWRKRHKLYEQSVST